ncbi:MAG: endonuclease/exonuclease/phosphatase family protein, partial [Bryocella sp.]
HQFPANLLAVSLPSIGLAVVGLRVPAYAATPLLIRAWEWLEAAASSLKDMPSIVLGDLNVSTTSRGSRGGAQFSRILANGWHRAVPAGGATFFGHKGQSTEIDHVLATSHCVVTEAACVKEAGGYSLCGSPNGISDHAALACRVSLR